jgi:hypothetical protein
MIYAFYRRFAGARARTGALGLSQAANGADCIAPNTHLN